ncbi:3-deoxy-manno-octulosonate cytidylyltransferase [Burkholderiales bacterium 8X]|nr:3-deoxy-manno-octulosonate cytidylyltransferase [Burkholderiales bacterium 8X]
MNPAFVVLVPARLASSRLPGKPLADIAGVPMVVRVARQAAKSGARRVVVAADDESIAEACRRHGVEAILTRTDHASGSDRLAEACELLALADDEIVVNVQGDEPLIDPDLIDAVARMLMGSPAAVMSTAVHPIDRAEDFSNPNIVKAVLDQSGHALYFSRAPIPWPRDAAAASGSAVLPPHAAALRHIGIYGYRAGFLRTFPALPPAPIEACEALEQLRVLWHGLKIAVHVSALAPGPGVDTPADLERARSHFAKG